MFNSQRFCDLIESNDDWLIERIIFYAKKQNYVKYTSTLKEAWRISIACISESFLNALKTSGFIPELGPDDDYTQDPVASFGILEAQRHRARGISLGMFLSLMKYYRQSYKDLVNQAGYGQDYEEYCRMSIERFFDRLEIGFCVEWSELSKTELTEELKTANRNLTNEKNKYLTIFESLPNPVVLVDGYGKIENINNATAEYFRKEYTHGAIYYGGNQTEESLNRLYRELAEHFTVNETERRIEKEFDTLLGKRHFQVKLRNMLDVSKKLNGTVLIFNDITELKKTEGALRKSEASLKAIFDSAAIGITLLDLSGRILSNNSALQKMLGYSDEELCSMLFTEFTHPDDIEADLALYKELVSGQRESFQMEKRYITKDGHTIWGRKTVSLVRSDDGKPKFVLFMVEDVSQRKEAEVSLSWESQVNEAIADLSRVLLSSSSINEISELILGHAKRLTGSAFGYVGYIDTQTGYLVSPTLTRDIWDTCQVENKDVIFKKFSGLWGWVLNKKKPILTNTPGDDPRSSGTPQGHVPINRFLSVPSLINETLVGQISLANSDQNYTERDLDLVERLADFHAIAIQHRRVEEELRESEEKFRQMSASAQDAIIMIDNDGRVSYWNEAATRIFGYSTQDSLGKDIHKLLAPQRHYEACREGFNKFKSTGQCPVVNRTTELVALTKEGREIPIELSISEVKLKGKWNSIGILRDITEQKLFQKELQQAKEAAEAASLVKSQFLASMSHELRTPLNAIIGFSEILIDETFGKLNQKQTRYVNNILTSGNHLLLLINDILDLSRIEAGRMVLELSRFEVGTALNDIQNIVKPLATKKGLGLIVEVVEPMLPVTADQAKFKQILYNLLSNSIKFTPEGGNVKVLAAIVKEVMEGYSNDFRKIPPYSNFLLISVSDTGIGIKPADQERIFREFEQVDSSHARQQQGTGLGLALTRKLVELHGGQIKVESEGIEGKGSTFTILLPLEVSKEKDIPFRLNSEEADDVDIESFSGNAFSDRPIVLVVEDDLKASELLTHHLSKAGFEVMHDFDGSGVIRKTKEFRPFAITLDIILKGVNRWDLLEELKSLPETKDIPVIVISIIDNRQLGFRLGAYEYLVKPMASDQLVETLHSIIT